MKTSRLWWILILVGLASAGQVYINHLGYHPNANKWAQFPHSAADSFYVRQAHNDSIVLRGALAPGKVWNPSQELVQSANFSTLKKEGLYVVEAKGGARSLPFRIRSDVYANAYRDIQRGFYFWRASTDIPEEFGEIFARPLGHTDDTLAYHEDLGKKAGSRRDVSRGWYDAGDYGKYVVNAGMTVAMLQLFLYLHPNWTGDEVLNLPESGNGIPDLYDELRWEYDWLLKMQDTDGGVFFKVTPKKFSGNVMPDQDPSIRFVIGKSTTSTLNFVGMTAQAYRRFKDIDPVFADTCLARAKLAWAWAENNPKIAYTQGASSKLYKDVSTGGYGDNNFNDEFYWAAAELYLSTKDTKYQAQLTGNYKANTVGWNSVATLGIYSLALEGAGVNATESAAAAQKIMEKADEMVGDIANSSMRLPAISFYWGSNGGVAASAATLLAAFKLTGDSAYIKAAGEVADYFFGKNPLNRSYVTGLGHNAPRNPHARILIADGIADPIPGYVVGGPNGSGGDSPLDRLVNQGCAAAKCYTDVTGSYASNEIAINWQGPLTLLVGAVEATLGGKPTLPANQDFAPAIITQATPGLTVTLSPAKASYTSGEKVSVSVTESDKVKFKGWIGDLNGSTKDTTITVTGDLFIKALGVEYDKNLVKNPNFKDSIKFWSASPYIAKQGAYGTTTWGADTSLQIKVFELGKQLEHVYAVQQGLTLVQGVQYTIEVEAKGGYVRDLGIKLIADGTVMAQRTAVLSLRYYKYAYSFTAPRTSENVALHLEAGLDSNLVNIKSVKLYATTKSLAADELVDGVLPRLRTHNLGAKIQGNYLHFAGMPAVNTQVEIFDKAGRKLAHSRELTPVIALAELLPHHHTGVLWVRVRHGSSQQVLPWVKP